MVWSAVLMGIFMVPQTSINNYPVMINNGRGLYWHEDAHQARQSLIRMFTYVEIKSWLSEKENKQKIIYGICFILVFIIGFGTGKLNQDSYGLTSQKQVNYSTKSTSNPAPAAASKAGDNATLVKGTSTPASCVIKGNINSKGYKIYHVPGGQYYKIVKPEQCFNTEAEAQAAGFVKSSR